MKKEKNKYNCSYEDDYKPLDISSATEYTGMVPTPPLTESEVEGLSSVYFVPQKKATQTDGDGKKKRYKK
ncbi:MAG: hypothetical protein WDA65_08880 [Christensenellales bacterium]